MFTYTVEELRNIFQSQFEKERWNSLIQYYFEADEIKTEWEKIDRTDNSDTGYYLGAINTDDSYRIGLFYYDINRGSVLNKRVGLRNLVKSFVNQNWGEFDAALVVFNSHDHWRLSFVCDIKDEKTAPKRYTFVFGDKTNYYNTPVSRFLTLQQKGISFANIKEAFSVEALTKQFYNDLFEWYQWAVSDETGISFPNNTLIEDDDRENLDVKVIRLITRIMFVWFIKQKDLVPDNLFDPCFLNTVLKNFNPQDRKSGIYYNAILQNLFFATLNRAIVDEDGNKRGFAKVVNGKDLKNLYRYAEMFKISEDEVIDLFAGIPFLNGGLFECLDKTKTIDGVDKAYNYDGFSRNDKTFADGRYRNRAVVPNVLFFMPEKGLFSIFSRYNFTVEENSPNEQQVALDPELLGKVFENLLGAYNPETKETARNQSGSFYTPREVVNYMVDESLKSYLGESDIVDSLFKDNFVRCGSNEVEYRNIAEKLRNVKVLDPACGSGAFPMGLLNRIVDILQKIETESSVYQLKLDIIENCLYGSDIQSIAAQISKLRFFISLICDCEKDDSKPNFGIPTLPNLETKFVAANSLIGKKKRAGMGNLFEDPEIETTKQELTRIRHEHFSAKTASKKRYLRDKDQALRIKLAKLLSDNRDFAPEDAKQLADWNPYDQNAVSPFFDSEWMFGIEDGFDIVIGNPPYISTKGVTSEDKKAYEKEFGFSDDTYSLFTFKGLQLTKTGGSLTYIIPKTFWTTQTKRNMRDLILSKNIRYIFDTANPFESVMVDTCIIQVINENFDINHHIRFLDGSENLLSPIEYSAIKQMMYIDTQNSVIFKPTDLNLKIWNLYGKTVKDLYNKWWDKIKTSRDIEKNKKELELYRANLKPGDVALLGCLTEGGQGLATANNGKYIAVRRSTKWAANIVKSRPKKLAEAIKKYKIIVPGLDLYENENEFLESLTEKEISILFDSLKEKYGRDIFGQGYIYKIIEDSELADVENLTPEEKEKGIDTSKNYYVPYDKGDKDGNRWYLETPFAIAWSKENVHFLKNNSGKKGEGMPVVRNAQFFFREGFCWNNVLNPNARLLKVKIKASSVNDVGAMSLYPICNLESPFFIAVLNSNLIFDIYREFINCTVNIQINDLRQLPIRIPNKIQLLEIYELVTSILQIKKGAYSLDKSHSQCQSIDRFETLLDDKIRKLYLI